MSRPLVTQLAHVCILAHDLTETERFWVEVLGLELAFRFTREGRGIGFYLATGAGTFIEVFERAQTSFSESDQINHLCLAVSSLDDAVAAIRGHGVAITDKKLGIDQTWQAWTEDPNGVKVELFEYPPSAPSS